ncbi:MAG: DNA adenine methylase [Reyranella sp.]
MKESTRTLIPVHPTQPVAAYIGGKRNLADTIIQRIRRTPHTQYAEPFVGMGGVFMRRPFRAQSEVINDLSRDVATLMRVLQRHYVAFLDTLKWQLSSRAEFERLMKVDPDTLTDLERSARFLYLQRLAFGGKVRGRNFGVSYNLGARFDLTKLVPLLEAAHERLAGVTIECLPWDAFVDRYDRKGVLFFLDPPYWGSEDDYGRGQFPREQFELLADRLRRIEGRFLVSLNDVPEVRRLFRGCQIEPVQTTYTLAGGPKAAKQAKELLISGPTRRGR